jgi:hypothetical protein
MGNGGWSGELVRRTLNNISCFGFPLPLTESIECGLGWGTFYITYIVNEPVAKNGMSLAHDMSDRINT